MYYYPLFGISMDRVYGQVTMFLCLTSLIGSCAKSKKSPLFTELPIENCDFIPSKERPIEINSIRIRYDNMRVDQNWIKARFQYSVNLRRPLTSFYDLHIEITHSNFRHISYKYQINDICKDWSGLSSKCQRRKRRFRQRKSICLCHMPTGLYSQKIRMSYQTPKLLSAMVVSQKKFSIRITLQIRDRITQKNLMCYTITDVPIVML